MRPLFEKGSDRRRSWCVIAGWFDAFTLIEMLTVIAIIGILAGILIPTTMMVMKKARTAKARADIAGLETAVQNYINDFGAPPPDSNAFAYDNTCAPFTDMDTPNECLVWFLTREFTTSDELDGGSDTPGLPGGNWSTAPEQAEKVFSRKRGGPYLDIRAKQRKDYDQDDFYEFVDPWGRPYLYRAYRRMAIRRITHSGGDSTVYVAGGTAPGGTADSTGSVTISGTVSNEGTHTIKESGKGWFKYTGGAAETPDDGYIVMEQLHNRHKEYDLYSVGPNGKTRAAANLFTAPYTGTSNGPTEMAKVWGSSRDGNDLAADQNGNSDVTDDRDRDDICNWAQ